MCCHRKPKARDPLVKRGQHDDDDEDDDHDEDDDEDDDDVEAFAK